MSLLAVAYPELSEASKQMIEACRKENDGQYHLIAAHFTFVFPVEGMPPAEFISEVRKQAAGIAPIPFSIGQALVHQDSLSDNYYAFLVPDDGAQEIAQLHDSLYSGTLAPHLRRDIAYIPHITIGMSSNKTITECIVAQWNERRAEIEGTVSSIDIVSYENNAVTSIENIRLVL